MTGGDTGRLSRRRVLRTSVGVGSAKALAGCLGGGGGGDDGGDDDSGDGSNADSTTQDLCGRIPGEFVAYDAGETDMVCDLDFPATFEGELNDLPSSSDMLLNRWIVSSEERDDTLSIKFTQIIPDSRSAGTSPNEYPNRSEILDIEFDGETTTFYGTTTEPSSPNERLEGHNLAGDLPYIVGDTTVYFEVEIGTSLNFDSDISGIPDDCRASVEEVTRQVTESLRVNEETTIADTLEEMWDEPP